MLFLLLDMIESIETELCESPQTPPLWHIKSHKYALLSYISPKPTGPFNPTKLCDRKF